MYADVQQQPILKNAHEETLTVDDCSRTETMMMRTICHFVLRAAKKNHRQLQTHVGESKCDVHRVRCQHQLTALFSAGTRRKSRMRVQVQLLVFLFRKKHRRGSDKQAIRADRRGSPKDHVTGKHTSPCLMPTLSPKLASRQVEFFTSTV